MTQPSGARGTDLRAPLLLAWQLTNSCRGSCLACCEDSGPGRAWPAELSRDEALGVARQAGQGGVPYVVFGGGEPMAVPHFWELLEALSAAACSLKIETDGLLIDEAAAGRLASLGVATVQVSLDGATASTHERLRPGGSHAGALAALRRLARRAVPGEAVFTPTRLNLAEIGAAFELSREAGAVAFVTGPLMRLGRAWEAWDALAPDPSEWERAVADLRARAGAGGGMRLSLYPWDIQREIAKRLESPQAMVLVVPDGKVKLLNALPFAPADLRRHSLAEAWELCRQAWDDPRVRDFAALAASDPALLRHANETWDEQAWPPAADLLQATDKTSPD